MTITPEEARRLVAKFKERDHLGDVNKMVGEVQP